MAEGKKSFVLYSDQRELFDKLPDETAGKLIKFIFSYVNDEKPETTDFIVDLAFTQIKNQLKRDLKKWEKQKQQRVEAGKRSAEIRKAKQSKSNEKERNSTSVKSRSTNVNEKERNSTVNDNVNVNVNVNDNVNDNIINIKHKSEDFQKNESVHFCRSMNDVIVKFDSLGDLSSFYRYITSTGETCTIKDIENALKAFFAKLEAEGTYERDFRDIRKHFNNYALGLIKQKNKENEKRNSKKSAKQRSDESYQRVANEIINTNPDDLF